VSAGLGPAGCYECTLRLGLTVSINSSADTHWSALSVTQCSALSIYQGTWGSPRSHGSFYALKHGTAAVNGWWHQQHVHSRSQRCCQIARFQTINLLTVMATGKLSFAQFAAGSDPNLTVITADGRRIPAHCDVRTGQRRDTNMLCVSALRSHVCVLSRAV
jgi:hypothetical protein